MKLLAIVCFFLATSAVCGCGQNGNKIVPVSGKVTLDGEPLAGGVINFQPQAAARSSTAGPGSSSRIDENGSFRLETIDGIDGAAVATHKVKVYSYSPETPVASDRDTGPRKERVPAKYNYQTTLTFEVPSEGTAEANFELTTD